MDIWIITVTASDGPRKRSNNARRSVFNRGGQWIVPDVRRAIYNRDNWLCLACGLDLSTVAPRLRTLDHIRPRAKGGSNKATNLYTCCLSCNSKRGTAPLRAFVGPETLAMIYRQARKALKLPGRKGKGK